MIAMSTYDNKADGKIESAVLLIASCTATKLFLLYLAGDGYSIILIPTASKDSLQV